MKRDKAYMIPWQIAIDNTSDYAKLYNKISLNFIVSYRFTQLLQHYVSKTVNEALPLEHAV